MSKLIILYFIFLAGIHALGMPAYAFSQDYCFEEAGKLYGISPALLWAISREESGFNPSAINYNRNGSYDYCHMQVNSVWASEVGERVWGSLGDPCQCTITGAWILSKCIKLYGYTWQAVGCYHAKSEEKRMTYSWKVHRGLIKHGIMAQRNVSEGAIQRK
jgi:hypothetical protein